MSTRICAPAAFALSINSVGVRNDQVCALSLGATDLIGLFDQLPPFRIFAIYGTQHDHAVAETQLRVRDRTVRIGIDPRLPLEKPNAEHSQSIAAGCIAVAKTKG